MRRQSISWCRPLLPLGLHFQFNLPSSVSVIYFVHRLSDKFREEIFERSQRKECMCLFVHSSLYHCNFYLLFPSDKLDIGNSSSHTCTYLIHTASLNSTIVTWLSIWLQKDYVVSYFKKFIDRQQMKLGDRGTVFRWFFAKNVNGHMIHFAANLVMLPPDIHKRQQIFKRNEKHLLVYSTHNSYQECSELVYSNFVIP